MRTIAAIASDIAALDAKLRLLYAEHDEAIRLRNIKLLQLWDDEGKTFNAIGREVGMDGRAVKQFLWSRGRTIRGREALRSHKIRSQRMEALNGTGHAKH